MNAHKYFDMMFKKRAEAALQLRASPVAGQLQ
jgi:hypothetical protein